MGLDIYNVWNEEEMNILDEDVDILTLGTEKIWIYLGRLKNIYKSKFVLHKADIFKLLERLELVKLRI